MNKIEYQIMNDLEENHWWYIGLRGYLSAVFKKYNMIIPQKPVVLDVGCGTGANLRHMNKIFINGNFSGFDMSTESLKYSKAKNPSANIYKSNINNPKLADQNYDLVTILDVLYTTGFENSVSGLIKITKNLKPGGILIINDPAFQWLYGEHDRAVHTKKRYTKKDMLQFCSTLGLNPLNISYRNFFLFPTVALHRMSSKLKAPKKTEDCSSDVKINSLKINSILTRIIQFENWAFQNGIKFPWGSSVSLVAQKL